MRGSVKFYTENRSFLYGNNTRADLGMWHDEIREALLATGKMPEELEEFFIATRTVDNPDGTPRFMITTKGQSQ